MIRLLGWPNLISLFRLALVPAFIVAVCDLNDRFHIAFAMLLVMTASDALDGIIARRFGQKTRIGAFLDPLADKVLMTSAFLVLSAPEVVGAPRVPIPAWLAVIVIGRDVFISLGAGVIRFVTGRIDPSPSAVGKATTFMQFATIYLVLLSDRFPQIVVIAFVSTAAVTCASGLDYLAVGWRKLDFAGIPETAGHPAH